MPFATLPFERATQDPAGPAIADSRGSLTNAEFADAVLSAARRLHGLGIAAGDVVALKLSNRKELVTLLFAAWRLGATITPVNPSLTDSEVARQLEDSGARLLVVEDGSSPIEAVPVLPAGDVYILDGSDPVPEVRVDPDSLALLIYTSGTTGVPKGVMLDHANLDAMTTMGLQALEVVPDDRCLLILPLFHVNGIVVSVLIPLLAGASVVIADRFNPETFFGLIESENPTFFSAVPTIYSMLAALPETVKPDTASVRFAVCGAAPASAELLTRFEGRFGFPIVEGYGLSEGTCASTVNPVSGVRKPGTVGLPFPGQEIRIVDADGNEVPPGEPGEVIVRGPNVMRGYLGRPEDTAATIVDGWLHTGDTGRLDADGYLTIVGRTKEMIIRGGENIYPKEIEDVLSLHPAVVNVAVVGRPDPTWGEVVAAFVTVSSDIDRTDVVPELFDWCGQRLSPYKRPVSIDVLDHMPLNPVGKIDKLTLRRDMLE